MNPLCDLFPKLYAMVVSKEAKILEVWQNSEQGGPEEGGILVFKGLSMIGKWKMWRS